MKTPSPLRLTFRASVVLLLMLACDALAQPTDPEPTATAFPILTRLELGRDYGYFVGDEIPLTLIVEATPGVVLDLVNLPQKGEKHGLFEVRSVQITSSITRTGQAAYRAQYTLQYFGITPLSVLFEPLEILYALPQDRQLPASPYHYKSLRTQPVLINVSRIGPYRPTPPLDIKGPHPDSRSHLIWGSLSLSILLLLTSSTVWGWHWYQGRQQGAAMLAIPPSPAAQTLAVLRQEGAALRPVPDSPPLAAERLGEVLRQHCQQLLGIPVQALTNPELAARLAHLSMGEELLQLLERCDALKYQELSESQTEVPQLWWEAMTLFEKLQEGSRS